MEVTGRTILIVGCDLSTISSCTTALAHALSQLGEGVIVITDQPCQFIEDEIKSIREKDFREMAVKLMAEIQYQPTPITEPPVKPKFNRRGLNSARNRIIT